MTDGAGVAHFDVTGSTVATWAVAVRVRALVPDGIALGDLLWQGTVNVKVR